MPLPTPLRATAALLAAALLLAGCRDPEVPAPGATADQDDQAAVPEPGPVASVPDPRTRVLDAEVDDLVATLVDALSGFEGLAQAATVQDAHRTTTRLLAVLSADPRFADPDGDGVPVDTGVRPLLPGPITSREETIDYGDVFSGVLTAGRDAGPTGAAFVDVLRDPIVGDLGSWQRDADGMIAGILATVDRVTSLDQAEQEVTMLQGEAARALAWALLADGEPDLATAQAYGERGAVHVDLMLAAVRLVLEPTPEGA